MKRTVSRLSQKVGWRRRNGEKSMISCEFRDSTGYLTVRIAVGCGI